MKDQVMTMKTHTESSKSELSSTTFGHFKVYAKISIAASGLRKVLDTYITEHDTHTLTPGCQQ